MDSHVFAGSFEANEGATYIVQGVEFGEPVPTEGLKRWVRLGGDRDSYAGYAYANQVSKLRLLINAASTATLRSALRTANAAIAPGEMWAVTLDGATATVRALIAWVDVEVPAYTPGITQYEAVYTIETYPGWRGAFVEGAWQAVSDVFATLDVGDVAGTLPADTAVWLCADQAPKLIGWGLRSNPAAAFAPLQDYSGTATANAKGGQTANLTMTGAWQTVGTPASLQADAHKGPSGRPGVYEQFARWLQDAATDSAARLRANPSVTGNGIGSVTAVPGDPVASTAAVPTAAGFEVATLGRIAYPPAGLPLVGSGGSSAGWGPEGARVTQDTSDGYIESPTTGYYAQTFVLAARTNVTKVHLHLANIGAAANISVEVWETSGGKPSHRLGYSAVASVSGATETGYDFTIAGGLDLAAGTYAIAVQLPTGVRWYEHSSGPYADGKQYIFGPTSWNEIAGSDDFRFVVFGSLFLVFDSGAAVQATCSESSKVVKLDQTALLPVDEAACIYTPSAALVATQGVLCDAASFLEPVDAFLCSVDGSNNAGVATSVLGLGCEIMGNPRLRPGVVNRFVIVIYTPSDATPTGAKVKVDHTPVYATPLEV